MFRLAPRKPLSLAADTLPEGFSTKAVDENDHLAIMAKAFL